MITLAADYRFGKNQKGQRCLGQGWSAPEANGIWSVGSSSTLVLQAVPGRGALALELTVEPFRRPPKLRHQMLHISINGTEIAARRLGGPLTWWLPVPTAQAVGDMRLQLRCPDATSPRAAAGDTDDRPLGIRLTRIAAFRDTAAPPPAAPVPPGDMAFGWNETTEPQLEAGWGEPEDQYVWAIGQRSILRLPLDGSGAPLLALVDMRPYLEAPALPRQRYAVGADGRLVTFLDLRCQTTVALPLTPTPGQTSLHLTFDHLDAHAGDPARRHHHGLPFGFMLFSVRLLPAPPAATPRTLPKLPGRLADGALQANIGALTGLTPAELVSQFESLGNGCALGLLQQQLGAARPGLLQFSEWWQPRLIDALCADFARFGRPDRLEWVERHPTDPGWVVRDLTYDIGIPTPYDKCQPLPPRAAHIEASRLPRLAEKLLEDLATGDKIFAFRSGDPLTQEGATALRAALARRADVTALWLTNGPPESLGSVERLGHGLLRGYHPTGAAPADTLLSVLANAWALARGFTPWSGE